MRSTQCSILTRQARGRRRARRERRRRGALLPRARRARRRRPTRNPTSARPTRASARGAASTLVAAATRRRASTTPISSSSRPACRRFAALDAAEQKGVRSGARSSSRSVAERMPRPVVAIGGTNGKSTDDVARRCAPRGARARKSSSAAISASRWPTTSDEAFDVVVLEVSSFQMERVDAFRPGRRALLNVTDDHLDRYASFEAYAHAKGNAFVRQTARRLAVVPAGDDVCVARGAARRGARRHVRPRRRRRRDRRRRRRPALRRAVPRAAMALTGGHNALNVAAAIACVAPFGVDARRRRATCSRRFAGLPHRMALVAEIDGVRYYDDSKGTNVGASVTALAGLREAEGGAHRRRARQGRQLRAARRRARARRAARSSSSARPRTRIATRHRRPSCPSCARATMDEAVRVARVARAARRRRAAVARVLELRHVPRLQAPRRRVRARRARARRRRRPHDRRSSAGTSQHATAASASSSSLRSTPRPNAARASGPIDPVLAAVVVALIGFGVVMVYSARAVQATVQYHDPQFFLKRQAAYAVVVARRALRSRAASTTTASTSSRIPVLAVVGVLLVAVRRRLRSLGRRRDALALDRPGARAARGDGEARARHVARVLAREEGRAGEDASPSDFLPHLLVAGVFMLLCMKQPDFGSAVVLLLLTFTMLFVAGAKVGYILGASILGRAFGAVAIRFERVPLRALPRVAEHGPARQDLAYQPFQSRHGVRLGRTVRRRPRARSSDALLAGGAQRLRRGDRRRRARLRRHRSRSARRIFSSSRAACARRCARRTTTALPRVRHRDDVRRAGAREPRRRARDPADEGPHASVRELRRLVAARERGGRGHPPQHLAAGSDDAETPHAGRTVDRDAGARRRSEPRDCREPIADRGGADEIARDRSSRAAAPGATCFPVSPSRDALSRARGRRRRLRRHAARARGARRPARAATSSSSSTSSR